MKNCESTEHGLGTRMRSSEDGQLVRHELRDTERILRFRATIGSQMIILENMSQNGSRMWQMAPDPFVPAKKGS